jgi:hypothetical protein
MKLATARLYQTKESSTKGAPDNPSPELRHVLKRWNIAQICILTGFANF